MPRCALWNPGNAFEIALGGSGFAYGIVIEFPLAGFFAMHCADRPAVPEIVSQQIAIRIWIMRSCISNRGWPVIGSVSLPDALRAIPDFYKFDAIARRFSLYGGHAEEPATREQCLGLECAAVWSALHVESRLEDHFAGRPNRWVEARSAAPRP